MPRRWILAAAAAAVLALAGVGVAFAVRGDGNESASPNSGSEQPQTSGSPLHDARRDAANRAGVGPLDVRLLSLRHAGFDGCLGVRDPLTLCTMQFIGGYIAVFEAGGQEFRYHFGGDTWVGPVDLSKAEDGSEVPPEIRADFGAILAGYARHELALRLDVAFEDIVTTLIAPVETDGCLGFAEPARACTEQLVYAHMFRFLVNGETYTFTGAGIGVVYHDLAKGTTVVEPAAGVVDVELAMREDLAARLGLALDEVSISSYREGTWSDGCLGIIHPARTCLAEPVDGFIAELTAGGEAYRYHGAGSDFIAASFEEGATLIDPDFSTAP